MKEVKNFEHTCVVCGVVICTVGRSVHSLLFPIIPDPRTKSRPLLSVLRAGPGRLCARGVCSFEFAEYTRGRAGGHTFNFRSTVNPRHLAE